MKKARYSIFKALLALYFVILLIDYGIREYEYYNRDLNIGKEKEYAVMRDLMTSCGISGIVDSVKISSVVIKLEKFTNSFYFIPKEYKPKFSFKKGGNYEYLEIEVSISELQCLKVGMTAEKEAGKDSINVDTVSISLF